MCAPDLRQRRVFELLVAAGIRRIRRWRGRRRWILRRDLRLLHRCSSCISGVQATNPAGNTGWTDLCSCGRLRRWRGWRRRWRRGHVGRKRSEHDEDILISQDCVDAAPIITSHAQAADACMGVCGQRSAAAPSQRTSVPRRSGANKAAVCVMVAG